MELVQDLNLIGAFVSGLVGSAFGAGGAYMAVKLRLKSVEERLTKAEAKLENQATDFKMHGERLVRIETKLDIILNKS